MSNKIAFGRRYPTKEEVLAKKAAEEKASANKKTSIQQSLIDRSKGNKAWQRIGQLRDSIELSASLDDHLLSYEP